MALQLILRMQATYWQAHSSLPCCTPALTLCLTVLSCSLWNLTCLTVCTSWYAHRP